MADGQAAGRAGARVVVVGAGIAGLAAAFRLTELAEAGGTELTVTVVEAKSRVGGVIMTRSYGDFVVEYGPDSFLTQKPWALTLCERLGLSAEVIATEDSHRRTFVARDGTLVPLPDGFMMMAPARLLPFVSSPLFSIGGKLRMALEPFIPARRGGDDESLAAFVRRRLGGEALSRVAQPMVGGVYTGDPERLSLRATMPRFVEFERNHGSVIRGLLAERGGGTAPAAGSGARYSMFASLKDGMQSLTDALSARLGPQRFRLGTAVSKVVAAGPGKDATWQVVLADGQSLPAEAVVVALPADQAASALSEACPAAAAEIASIELASSAVVNLVYARADVGHALDGFGFVVPASEGRSILACSFSSVKFGGRAPEGKVLFRVFMGGALQPDIFRLSDPELETAARVDVEEYLAIGKPPLSVSLMRCPDSMPQYNVGHLERVDRIEAAVAALPRQAVAGNAYRGVGIPDCIRSGEQAAESIMRELSPNVRG